MHDLIFIDIKNSRGNDNVLVGSILLKSHLCDIITYVIIVVVNV